MNFHSWASSTRSDLSPAAAGADQQLCPVDETGRLRGVCGVWVADASILPSCPEVNPQLSIMALALGVADQIVDEVVHAR